MALAAPGLGQDAPPTSREAVGDSLAAAIRRGRARLDAGEPRAAVTELRRAQGLVGLALLYGDGEPHYYAEQSAIQRGLAGAYLDLGDAYAAAVEAASGVNLDEKDARLWTLLGLARYRLADVTGAAEALERASALDDRDPDTHWGRALVAMAGNRPDEARLEAGRALDLAPRPRYALGLARWSAVAGDYAAAADALGAWLRLAPADAERDAYAHLRDFYRELSRAPALAIDPRVTRAQVNFDLKPGDEIPYVPVSIDGGDPVYVLLDTGAERNVLDRDFARAAGIGPIRPGGRLHGAYRSSDGGYAIVDSLSLGGITVRRVPFAVGDFAALNLRRQGAYYIAGVVNPAILFRDFLVVLDYGHRRIELVRSDAGGAGYAGRSSRIRKATTPFHFDANGVWPVVGAHLDGFRALPMLVDTGASDLLIGRDAAAALRLDPRRFSVEVAARRVDDLRGLLLDEFPGEPWGMDLQGILGFPYFRGMRVAFDYRDMTLTLEN